MGDENIHELDTVALVKDLPRQGLQAGQTGAVVYVHDGGAAFEVEFVLTPRKSVVETVDRSDLLKLKGLAQSRAAG